MQDLPKIDLHLQLEGAAPPAFLRDLARARHLDISGIFGPDGGYASGGFRHLLRVQAAAFGALQRPEDFRRLTLIAAEEAAAQGVVYAELRLSPDLCGGGDLPAWRDFLAAIAEAAAAAAAQPGITLRAIVTPLRHLGPDRARRAALCAAETAGAFVVGLGLAGDEAAAEVKAFRWAFDCAREAGLRLTADAGRWRGPEAVRAAIRDLGVERIGHASRLAEDPALVDALAERGTMVELCPGADLALGLVGDLRAHPAGRLHDRGVKLSLSPEAPAFFRTGMAQEYDRLNRAFGWDEGVFRQIARQSLDAAFCDADTRAMIVKKLEAADA